MTGHDTGTATQEGKSRPAWRRFLPLAVILLATGAVVASGAHRYLTLDELVASRGRLAGWVSANQALALMAFALVYVVAVTLSIPGASLLTVTGGLLFGGFLGGSVAVVSATVGATLLFLAAGSSFGDLLRDRAGPFVSRLREGFKEGAASYMLFLRLVPAFPFWAVNLAPALLGIPLRTYVWTTAVGILPGTFAFAFAGAGLDSVALAQKQAYESCLASGVQGCAMHLSLSQLVTPQLIGALAALGLVALIPVLMRRWRANRQG
jgi:uncharacterized membrane protein YdjX (TVP38/TMEM64 family)